MRNLDQIKSIVHAKWTDSNGGEAAALTQEELTQEAEKILKRSTSNSKIRWISRQKFYLFQRIKWPDKQQSMSTGWLPSIAARIERWRWTLVSPWECVPHLVEIVAVTPKVWKTSIVSILSSLVCCQDLSKVGYVRGVVRRAHKVISSDIPLPMTVYQTNKVMINRIIFFHLNSVINL